MFKTITFFFCVVILLFSCDDEVPESIVTIDSEMGINLRSLQAGDVSKYVLYESSCDGDFRFTGDTLEVSIYEKNDTLLVREKYTPGSNREIEAEHAIIPKDGYVLIPQRFNSQFLFFYGNDTIFLDRLTNSELKQNGCRLFIDGEAFIGEEIGSVDQFSFGNFEIYNRRGVSCVPTIWEMEAYIFYEDHLNLVHTLYRWLKKKQSLALWQSNDELLKLSLCNS